MVVVKINDVFRGIRNDLAAGNCSKKNMEKYEGDQLWQAV